MRNLPWPEGVVKKAIDYNSTVQDVKDTRINATLGVLQKKDEMRIWAAFEEDLQWINRNTIRLELLETMAANRHMVEKQKEETDADSGRLPG